MEADNVHFGHILRPDQNFLSTMQETASCPDETTNGSTAKTKIFGQIRPIFDIFVIFRYKIES